MRGKSGKKEGRCPSKRTFGEFDLGREKRNPIPLAKRKVKKR